MPSKLLGNWKLKKSENFNEYMQKVGVNFALRKMGILVISTTEITEERANQVRINTQSTVKSSNMLFVLGEETDECTMDGRQCKTTVVWEGEDKLLKIQKWNDGKQQTKIEWMMEGDEMLLRLEYEGVVCRRLHERCG